MGYTGNPDIPSTAEKLPIPENHLPPACVKAMSMASWSPEKPPTIGRGRAS
jgi:hypothetical protein